MNSELTFCKMPLERASHLRKNRVWLNDKLSADDSYFYFYWRDKFLYIDLKLFTCHVNKQSIHSLVVATLHKSQFENVTFLGLEKDRAHFVYDLSRLKENELEQWLECLSKRLKVKNIKFIDFRRSLSLLSPEQSAILGYGKSLIHWHQSSVYCGSCGQKTGSMDGGHRRLCINELCQKELFPRTDPVVIMLIEYQPEAGPAMCLLAEHHRTPEQVYSTLAGFVDPGESLSEAVSREVFEEVGLNVTEVSYIDSQPWPFPNSIMLGFLARVKSLDINIEPEELRSADWFTAEQIATFNNWGDEVEGPKLPRKESIARLLIDSWCEKQGQIASK